MKLTTFGKVIRKLRIDHNILLGDMASKIGISSAYLSSIELGERPIPRDLFYKIQNCKIFNEDELLMISNSISDSTKEFRFSPENNSQRELMASLARNFESLTDAQIEAIQNTLNKKGGK